MVKKSLLCLGDSITYGYELPEASKWTTLLQERMSIDVHNYGLNGDTTAGMLSRYPTITRNQTFDITLITGGTNDLWFGLRDEYIIANLHTIYRQVVFNGGAAIIGLPTPVMNLAETNLVQEDYAECIRSFRNRLMRYCELKTLNCCDLGIGLQETQFLEDGVHPNEGGQAVIADNVGSTLMKVLKGL